MKPIESVASFMLRALGGDTLKQRYNEAINDGFLPCAPSTKIGEDRKLDTVDIIGTAIFNRCISMGFNSRRAGEYTCLAVDAIRAHKGTPIFKVVVFQKGKSKMARTISDYRDLMKLDETTDSTVDFNVIAILDDVNRLLDKAKAKA